MKSFTPFSEVDLNAHHMILYHMMFTVYPWDYSKVKMKFPRVNHPRKLTKPKHINATTNGTFLFRKIIIYYIHILKFILFVYIFAFGTVDQLIFRERNRERRKEKETLLYKIKY